jgi:hypothetical protein
MTTQNNRRLVAVIIISKFFDLRQTQKSRFTVLEIIVNRIGLAAADFNLNQHKKRHSVIQLTKLLNLVI